MLHEFLKIRFFACLALLFLVSAHAYAQVPAGADSAKPSGSFIEILNSEYTDYITQGTEQITKIVGNVQLRSGSDMLYCDSAIIYNNRKVAEAFGNVSIEQADGTQAFGDYLRYTGGSRVIFMRGDVMLTDNKGNDLWSNEVEYNLATKVGRYRKSGTLQSENTIVSSRSAEYNLRTNQARFKGDVVVNDPEYNVTSEDLGYNTESKIVRFYAPAVVQNENTTLFAKGGTYDAKNKVANFAGRSNIVHEAQFIEADKLDYDKNTGWAKAIGNVIAIDTAQKTTSYSGFLLYNEVSGKMMSTDRPLLKRRSDSNTLYIIADTFFSEPIANLERPDAGPIDTAQQEIQNLIKKMQEGVQVDSTKVPFSKSNEFNRERDSANEDLEEVEDLKPVMDLSLEDSTILDNDTTALPDVAIEDTLNTPNTRPERRIGENPSNKIYDKADDDKKNEENKRRYFLAYHNVLVYSDSAQGKCDSLRYSQSDSLMILYKNPVVWARESQVLGDTIYALLDSNNIQEVYVPKNALLIQEGTPKGAGIFDQVQAGRLHAFFVKNELDSAVAYPNVETIYFAKDDDDAFIGASEASSNRLRVRFKERKIKTIYYYEDFKQKMTPMQKVQPESLRLSRFNWREAERPKNLRDFLKHATEFQRKEILGDEEQGEASKSNVPSKAKSKKRK